MDITTAKKSLYETLKSFREVIGAGIQEKNGQEYIVIFLSKASKTILKKIPPEFEGNRVETQIKGAIGTF
jgi:uncharacterized FlaG/YvyC family protein